MSTWKELPRPATPGPWISTGSSVVTDAVEFGEWVADADGIDADAIAALPDYVAEVDRLASEWVIGTADWENIRAGEWPEGSKP